MHGILPTHNELCFMGMSNSNIYILGIFQKIEVHTTMFKWTAHFYSAKHYLMGNYSFCLTIIKRIMWLPVSFSSKTNTHIASVQKSQYEERKAKINSHFFSCICGNEVWYPSNLIVSSIFWSCSFTSLAR